MSWATEYFGPEIITKSGKKSTSEVVVGKKVIGIYFSAHWCPPCRQFTPLLSEFYSECKYYYYYFIIIIIVVIITIINSQLSSLLIHNYYHYYYLF